MKVVTACEAWAKNTKAVTDAGSDKAAKKTAEDALAKTPLPKDMDKAKCKAEVAKKATYTTSVTTEKGKMGLAIAAFASPGTVAAL